MKNLRYISLFLLGALIIPSCVDDKAPEDEYSSQPNMVSFATASANFAAIATGEDFVKTVNMKVNGPSLPSLTGPVTATISVDPASTAVEGVHYRLESNTITLSKDNDYLGTFPITMITEGIEPPLATNPTVILNVTQVSGPGKLIPNGKKITVSLNYLCLEHLAGTYSVVIPIARCQNATYGPNFPYTVTISANPDGSWALSSADGGFLNKCTGNSTLVNAGSIVSVCGQIQPSDNLNYGGDGIGNITGGTWDENTGVLTLQNSQTFSPNWPASWTSIYTRL